MIRLIKSKIKHTQEIWSYVFPSPYPGIENHGSIWSESWLDTHVFYSVICKLREMEIFYVFYLGCHKHLKAISFDSLAPTVC